MAAIYLHREEIERWQRRSVRRCERELVIGVADVLFETAEVRHCGLEEKVCVYETTTDNEHFFLAASCYGGAIVQCVEFI